VRIVTVFVAAHPAATNNIATHIPIAAADLNIRFE
jgi:hypothetical protein